MSLKRELNRIIKRRRRRRESRTIAIYKKLFPSWLRIPILRNMHILYREKDL